MRPARTWCAVRRRGCPARGAEGLEAGGGGEALLDEVGGGSGDVAEGGDEVVACGVGAELAADGRESAEVLDGVVCGGVCEEGEEGVGGDGACGGGLGEGAGGVEQGQESLRVDGRE